MSTEAKTNNSAAIATAQNEAAELERRMKELEAKQAAKKAAKAAEAAAAAANNTTAAAPAPAASPKAAATPTPAKTDSPKSAAATPKLTTNTSSSTTTATSVPVAASPKAAATTIAPAASPKSSAASSIATKSSTPGTAAPAKAPVSAAAASSAKPSGSPPTPKSNAIASPSTPKAAAPVAPATPKGATTTLSPTTAPSSGGGEAQPFIPAGAQLSGLGLLLGLKAPPPSSAPAPAPVFTLLPPPPTALAFPSLPALFTSRRSDGRRQGIMIGGGGMDMRSSLAAFRAQLGKGGEGQSDDSDDEDEEEDEDEEDEEAAAERKAAKEKKKKEKEKAAAAKAAAAAKKANPTKPAQITLPNGQKFPPDCQNKESKPVGVGCLKPSIFHCKECKENYCMDCDDLVHLRPAKKNHVRVRVTREHVGGETHKVAVKVVSKGVKSLPAMSIAGIKDQQAAQAQVEEKQNNNAAMAARAAKQTSGPAGSPAQSTTRIGGRLGLSNSSQPLGLVESTCSTIPLNLPKTANLLQFIPDANLRETPQNDLGKIFDFYCQATPAGDPKEKLRKEDLLKLSGDILERLRRLLSDEMKKQGLSASQIPAGIEKEMEFIVKGKNEEEKKNTLMLILLNKAGAKSTNIPKAIFLQVWGNLSAELFTVRTDGALGCIIC